MIPSVENFVFRNFKPELTTEEKEIAIQGRIGLSHVDYLKSINEFAIEILKYNLKRYKQQVFEFNTGDATKFKSIDDITFETIKELENK